MGTVQYGVIQNECLGAMVQWQFVKSWENHSDGRTVIMPWLLLILPLTYHDRSATAIARTNQASGIRLALQRDPESLVGLQRRVQHLATMSLSSLQIAVSTGLLTQTMRDDWPGYLTARKTLPGECQPQNPSNKIPLHAARRLGAWFAPMALRDALAILNVRF